VLGERKEHKVLEFISAFLADKSYLETIRQEGGRADAGMLMSETSKGS